MGDYLTAVQYLQPQMATAYGSVGYDPATTTAYGYQLGLGHGYQLDYNELDYNYTYDYSLEQEDEAVDEVAERQGFNPLTPLIQSVTFPLGAAVLTFAAMVIVAAAFLLFPAEVEVEVNSLQTGNRRKRSAQGSRTGSIDSTFCSQSSSTLCKVLNVFLSSEGCLEAASCEVAALIADEQYPLLSKVVRPFASSAYYKRFNTEDCSQLVC